MTVRFGLENKYGGGIDCCVCNSIELNGRMV